MMNFRRWRGFGLVFLMMSVGLTAARAAPARDAVPASAGVASAPARITESVTSLMGAALSEDRSANDLAWDCLGVAAAFSAAHEGDAKRLRGIADEIAADVVTDSRLGPKGWTASIQDARCKGGGYDAFGDGSCNATSTVYAFQSGLGMACLALASQRLGEPRYLGLAREVLNYWKSQTLPPAPGCRRCSYFRTSDSPNDKGRYVRNMNVFVAFGAMILGQVAGDAAALETGESAMRSDMDERQAGNRGYLGRLDPQYKKNPAESERIENHSAAVAVMALQAAGLTGSPALRQHAQTVWRDWATCTEARCLKPNCSYWAGDAARCQATTTASHCAFRSFDPLAARQCDLYLSSTKRVGGYGLYAFFLGSGDGQIPGR